MGSMMADLKGVMDAINNNRKNKGEEPLSEDALLVRLFNEVAYVWPRVGYPPLVTPFSQYVKNIALMNLLTESMGKPRYTVMDESIWGMILGKSGKLPGEVAPEIVELADGFPEDGERGLMVGDTIRSINGERVWYSSDFTLLMGRTGGRPVDVVVIRNGEKVKLEGYDLQAREYADSDGNVTVRYGVSFKVAKAGILDRLRYSVYTACNFVRLVRFSLADLVHGVVGLKDLSGPVGIVSAINDLGHTSSTVAAAISNIAFLCAFIAVNLAVMNLLPIPALDGGRIFLLIVTWVVEKIIRRQINPKYEGYIHAAGLVLLMGLMVVVMFSDVVKLFHG